MTIPGKNSKLSNVSNRWFFYACIVIVQIKSHSQLLILNIKEEDPMQQRFLFVLIVGISSL